MVSESPWGEDLVTPRRLKLGEEDLPVCVWGRGGVVKILDATRGGREAEPEIEGQESLCSI